MTHRPNRIARRAVFRSAILSVSIAGVLSVAGCQSDGTAEQPQTRPATAPTAAPTAAAAPSTAAPTTAPASRPTGTASTQPATPDPREAQYLTDVTQLTEGFDRAGEGYFSKDMKWIIFQATPKGEKEYQMYVASLEMGDGSSPRIGRPVRISPENSRNTCGYFSPDGKTVIFGSTAGKEKPDEQSAGYQRQGGNYRWAFPDGMEIYAAKDWSAVQTSSLGRFYDQLKRQELTAESFLVPTTQPVRSYSAGSPQAGTQESSASLPRGNDGYARLDLALPANRLTENNAYDAEGSYSPDGQWIVYTSRVSGDTEVWVMKADGSNPVQLTKSPNYDGGPFFAPDGKRIIYRSDRKGNDLLQIYVSELAFDDQGNITGIAKEHQITDDANVNWGPYFHPDNKHILYATSAHGHHNYELYLMKDDGSAKTRITYCAGFDGLPVFSTDGGHVMWSAKRSKDGTTQLFIARFRLP